MVVSTLYRINLQSMLIGFMLGSYLWIIYSMNGKHYEKINHGSITTNSLVLTKDVVYAGRATSTGISEARRGNSSRPTIESENMKDSTSLHNALLMYLDHGDDHMIHFTLFLYGSWKYVMSHKHLMSNVTGVNASHLPEIIFDLIVYCHPEACKSLPVDCNPIGDDNILEAVPRCWYKPSERLQSFPGYPSDYGFINTYTFLVDDHFGQIVNRYDWIMRTDIDVFISPGILGWVSKYPLVAGRGGYGHPFNENRLRQIAAKLGLRYQNISNIGSTWYVKSELFETAVRLALNLSVYLYNNEFNKSLPGLEGIFDNNPGGDDRWWHPLSTMYASELAINHLIPNLTENHKAVEYMDTASSDSTTPVMKVAHIHCWHGLGDFEKDIFTAQIVQFMQSDVRKLWLQNETMFYRNDLDVSGMTIKEYATYIAWNSVLKYLPHLMRPIVTP